MSGRYKTSVTLTDQQLLNEDLLDSAGNSMSSLGTKIAGEDLTNDILKIRDNATYTNITASALIKTGAGVLKGIVVNSHTSGTLKLWDNTTNAAPIIFNTISFAAGPNFISLPAVEFSTGLYATVGGTAADITLLWK